MSIVEHRRQLSDMGKVSVSEVFCAVLASSIVHLLLLIPTLITLQIYDRVLSSRHAETLVMLLVAATCSSLAWWLVETSRVRWYAARADAVEQHLAQRLTPWLLQAQGQQPDLLAPQFWKDIAGLRNFLAGPALLAVADLPWTPIYLLVIAAFHPLLGAVALVGILLLIALAWLTEWRLRGPAGAAEQAQLRVQRTVSEIASFAEVMHAHGQQTQVAEALNAIKTDASGFRLAAELAGHGLKTWGKLVRQILQLAMLATGAWLVIQGQATGGVMIAGSILLGKALMPLEVLIGSWKQVLETRKALHRLKHALAVQVRVAELQPETALLPGKGELRVVRLGFRPRPTEVGVLHNVGFSLPAGAMLVVLGASGSGKSTLARILAGVQPPTHGEVVLDGAAFHQYSDLSRGQVTGYLPQDILLYSGTVAHNIARLWRPAAPLTPAQSEAIVEAARRAGAHELITALPRGYDTRLGAEAGAHVLSGGQRQRIALARALYATPGADVPCLVVLDEPNSQLDAEGEAALERCLHELRRRGSTSVVVSHRSHLVALATHVLVLTRGTVEQFGPREQVRQWMVQRNQHAMKSQTERKAAVQA